MFTRAARIAAVALALVLASVLTFPIGHSNKWSHFQKPKTLSQNVSTLFNTAHHMDKFMVPKALGNGPDTFFKKAESDFYMLVGYPSDAVYQAMTGGNGPPEKGLLGIAKQISQAMAQGAVANGVTSCDDVPATGTFTGTADVGQTISVTFATPTHAPPTGYTGAGTTYAKRANMTLTDQTMGTLKVGMEWTCGQDGGYMEFAMAEPASGGQYPADSTRVFNLYADPNSGSGIKAEFMMTVAKNSDQTLYDSQIARLLINNTNNTYQLWSVNTYFRSSEYQGYRLGINGSSLANGKTSTYLDVPAASATIFSDATSNYTSHAASDHNFAQVASWSGDTLQGCLDFVAQTDPGSTTLCTGQSLTDPTAPLADSGGAFSFNWVDNTMQSKISAPSF